MLVEFTVGNYRSFRTPQTLSMVAASLKSRDPLLDENTVIQIANNPDLLTSAALYGANASGKSNLVQALAFMQRFVLNSPKETKPTGGIRVEPFRLHTATISQPSHFEIVFIVDGKRYRYGFEATQERVLSEWLYFVPSTREARLFDRQGDDITVGSYFKEGRDLEQHTRANALFLSVVAQFNGPQAQKLVTWFRRLGIISGVEDMGMMPFTLTQLVDGEHSQAIRQLIGELDLGIGDLHVEKAKGRSGKPNLPDEMPDDLRQAFLTIINAAETEGFIVRTLHAQYDDDGNHVGQQFFELDDQESEGTRKLFAMSGPLLDTLERGKVLVVDELDARLHPLIARAIISLFNHKATNPHGAQLIFNTHDTNLLDNALFRRDQIWFVEKDPQGASHLYSLAEFKVRNDKDYERGYIQGRYGAVPYLSHIQTIVSREYATPA